MFTYACQVEDIPDAGITSLLLGGKRIALARIGGDIFAIDNRCPHWGGPLGAGTLSVKRREIICPWHRFRFDLDTGACVASNLRKPACRYDVRLDGKRVLVNVPDRPEEMQSREGNPQ